MRARRGWVRGVLVVVGLLGLGGCTPLDNALAVIPFFSSMHEEPSFAPYELPRLPAANTVPVVSPRGEVLPAWSQTELAEVGATLQNPLTPTPEVLTRGEALYVRHCYVCHGMHGEGNGPVVGGGRFPFAPPVNSGPAVGFSDGYLYAITRTGRGLMPSYGDRIHHLDRWAVVLYMRELQRHAGGGVLPAAGTPASPETPAAPGAAPGTAPGAAPPAAGTPPPPGTR